MHATGVLNDDADDFYGISEDAIPSSEPRRNAKVNRPPLSRSKHRARATTVFDLFRPVRTPREVRLFWQLWHEHTNGQKTNWTRLATDWNQVVVELEPKFARHYHPKSVRLLQEYLKRYTSRLHGRDVQIFARAMHLRLENAAVQLPPSQNRTDPANVARQTFPSAPLYPESTLPEMSLPPHAQSSHSPHPAYASGMAAMQAPGPSAYDIPGPSPAEPAGPSAPHVQDLPSGPGPSYQVPAPAGPSSAAPPMHDNQAAGNQPVAAHFAPIFAQPIPPAAILNAPAKPAGRGAPPGRGKNCNDCWAYDCEQVFKANDNKCDPHAVPRVPLKGGHNCPHPGHFKKVQDENHPLRIIMNRAIKPSGSANRARHKAA